MIDSICTCGAAISAPESDANKPARCLACGGEIRFVASAVIAEGDAAGDFDARLVVSAGAEHVGERVVLGGIDSTEIGKLPGQHILLPGRLVSREHCRPERVGFGPSVWRLCDRESTNGTLVNGKRIGAVEL